MGFPGSAARMTSSSNHAASGGDCCSARVGDSGAFLVPRISIARKRRSGWAPEMTFLDRLRASSGSAKRSASAPTTASVAKRADVATSKGVNQLDTVAGSCARWHLFAPLLRDSAQAGAHCILPSTPAPWRNEVSTGEVAMSTGHVALLGAIASVTIFFGLAFGRVRTRGVAAKTLLNAIATGILVFLFFDILQNAVGSLQLALFAAQRGRGTWASFGMQSVVFVLGFSVGLLSLVYLGRLFRPRSSPTSVAPPVLRPPSPGAEPGAVAPSLASRQDALRLSISIASGIGLHNLSEGLAIGQAAHVGQVSLAALLVVGFALHNATEGFGIVGPLAATGVRPTWGWLLRAGVIGGGPTFVGALFGSLVVSPLLFVGSLALAAGAIVFVVGELLAAGRRLARELTMWGVLLGFFLGLATDFVLVAAGA